jgi:hypothetical protein
VPQGHPRQVGPTMANGAAVRSNLRAAVHCAAAMTRTQGCPSQRAEPVVNPGSPQPSPVTRYMEILLNQEPRSGEETFS